MNTKYLMLTSAIFYAIMGLSLSFLPQEVAGLFQINPQPIVILFLQLLSGFLLGFAMLNWNTKSAPIGGIYNKPIALANLLQFIVGAFAILKLVGKIEVHQEIIMVLTTIYVIFASLFLYVFRTNPTPSTK